MFKAYIEDYSAVYEPAEGGYYVPVSTVHWWQDFETIEEAEEALEQMMKEDTDTYRFFYNINYNGVDDAAHIAALNVEIGRDTGYIGEGQEVWVVDENDPQPENKVYNGYC